MELKAGYKLTEVGVIPEDWDLVLLDSVAKRGSGHTPDKSHPEYWNGGIKWISLQDTGRLDRCYISDTAAKITEAGLENSSAILHPSGTVVLSRDAGVGKSAIMTEDMAVSQHFMAWSCGPSLDNHYLYYRLQAQKPEFERIAMGNTIKTIGLSYFKRFAIPLPINKAEQEALAKALSDADTLIELLERLLTKKRQIKQGAMLELLSGKKRLPGFSGEWEMKKLGDIVEIQKGQLITQKDAVVGNIPVVAGGKQPAYYHNTPNRLGKTITISGSGASAGYVSIYRTPIFASDCSTIGEGNTYDIEFFYGVLLFNQNTIYKAKTGGAQPHIHPSDLKPLSIMIPLFVEEQIAIASVLSDMDAEIVLLEMKLTKTRQIKQGMMRELLTGKIRLISPASKVISFSTQKPASSSEKAHNSQINEAVIIAILAKRFGSEEFPLGRKRCTKLTYLLHRRFDHRAEGYLKKAAGPYNPATKYKGPEAIAQKNGYIREHTNGTYSGFVAAANIVQAEAYFQKWYGKEALQWLEQFHYAKNDELELLATVDMAMKDLRAAGQEVCQAQVKQAIESHPAWKPKLARELFSDANIARGMERCRQLFG